MLREKGRRKTDAEQIGQRVRAQARALAGRVFARGGQVLLVVGEPELDGLLRGLNRLPGPPDAAETPGPSELGFPASAIQVVTPSGLSSRARSLQKWRKMLREESGQGHPGSEFRAKGADWEREVAALSQRVPILHGLLAENSRACSPSPFRLEADVENTLSTMAIKVATGRVVPTALDWLVRFSTWVSGVQAARRLLATTRDALCDPINHQAREGLNRVRTLARRLAADLRRPDVPCHARREWRSVIQFDQIRQAVSDLPAGVASAARFNITTRNRDLDLDLLVRRCDDALLRFPKEPTWRELTRVTALYLTDGGTTPLPWAAVAGGSDTPPPDQGDRPHRLLDLVAQGRKQGYEQLLNAIGTNPKLIEDPERARSLLVAGATVSDVSWCFADQYAYDLSLDHVPNLRPVHALVEWFEARGEALDRNDVDELLRVTTGPAARAGLECLNRHLAWLPKGPGAPQIVAAVREVVRMLSAFRELPGPLCDRLRQWAEPPRGTRLPEGCPSDLPEGLPALIRRLAFYRRMAGQPDRLPKSLRKPLEAAGRAACEAQHLHAREAAGALDEGQRARLRHLEMRAGLGLIGPSAAKLTRLAREACSLAAMDAIHAAFRREVERFWSKRYGLAQGLDTFRTDDLWILTNWIEDLPRADRDLVEPILAAYREHGPSYRSQLPGNRAWLNRAEGLGVVLERWFHPEPVRSKLTDGTEMTLGPAHDPRDVFLMGSRFHTCLGLQHGDNSWSVIANASHANKAVVYARDPSGRSLGRKLVALTSDFKLIGFGIYSVDGPDRKELTQAIEEFCGAWAAGAGLTLANKGSPEDLGGRGWYNDGAVDWSESALAPWERAHVDGPPLVDSAQAATISEEPEIAWCAAVRSDDPQGLEVELARTETGVGAYRLASAFWWIVRSLERPRPAPPALRAIAQNREFGLVRLHLAARGLSRGLASPNQLASPAWSQRSGLAFLVSDFLGVLPLDRRCVVDAIDQVCRSNFGFTDPHDFGPYCLELMPAVAFAPLADVVRLFLALERLVEVHLAQGSSSGANDWLRPLRLAWLRDRDPAPIVRAIREGGPSLREAVFKLCEEYFIPEAITELRRRLKRMGPDDESDPSARILAIWPSPQDRARVAAWAQRQQPTGRPRDPSGANPSATKWIGKGLGAVKHDLALIPKRIAQLGDDVQAPEALVWWRAFHAILAERNLLGVVREPVGQIEAAVARIPLDPHRSWDVRLDAAASNVALRDGSWFVRMGIAVEWIVAFKESERAALPVSARENLIRGCLGGLKDGWYSIATTLLGWLKTLEPDDQFRLWLEESTGVDALAHMWHERSSFAVLIQALDSRDPGTTLAARTMMAACAQAKPHDFLRFLDAAFHWLHPDRIEPLAVDLVSHLAEPADPDSIESHRLRRLLSDRGLLMKARSEGEGRSANGLRKE